MDPNSRPFLFAHPMRLYSLRRSAPALGSFWSWRLLFLMQALLGGATQHYRADLSSFFGIDLARLLPFNIARTWHLQLAIFWVSTSFLAAGIFLTPMIVGREPRRQNWLAYGLLVALAVVVFGSMLGEYAGIKGWIQNGWEWFGNQGFEYLDLGRFWQLLLIVGLLFWTLILFRGLRGRLGSEHMGNMPWLFFFSALSIPAFYAVGLLAHPASHFTTTDFWRFWVVHLWVEDFLELFTTIMVAYIFVLLGVVNEKVALHRNLPRHRAVLSGRGNWQHASCVFFRRTRHSHGTGCIFLGGRSNSPHISHR